MRGTDALLARQYLSGEVDGLGLLEILGRDESLLMHGDEDAPLAEHELIARIAVRGIVGRRRGECGEECSFSEGEFTRVFAEISPSGVFS